MRRAGIIIMILSALLCTASGGFASAPQTTPPKYPFTLDQGGIPGIGGERSVIVVISDIHLGMDDRYAEIQKNRAPLADLVRKIGRSPNVRELVIAGDFMDEWFIPAGTDTYAGKTQKEFVQAVAANNQEVVDAFNAVIREGKVRVTYVPGNHDPISSSRHGAPASRAAVSCSTGWRRPSRRPVRARC